MLKKKSLLLVIILFVSLLGFAQTRYWSPDGTQILSVSEGQIVSTDARSGNSRIIASKAQLNLNSNISSLSMSPDRSKILILTNSVKVWRYHTRGDYFLYDVNTAKLRKLGYTIIKPQTTMFAKFSPDGKHIAYVSNNNIYTEDVALGVVKKLTSDGAEKIINGTFDWAYEEEFGCRDGFRWSPDSRNIALWQVDARKIKEFFIIDNIDSNYSRPVAVEYPKVGESPSPVKIGVVSATGGSVKWMNIDTDGTEFYVPRMDWADNGNLILQKLNRKQNESKLLQCAIATGAATTFFAENDAAWVDLNATDDLMGPGNFNWVNGGRDFIWLSEKDGWRHIYRISKDGKSITDITPGNFDVGKLMAVDNSANAVYFTASPQVSYQLYLYRTKINDATPKDIERLTPSVFEGFNTYELAPSGKYAIHTFSSRNYREGEELVSLPDHKPVTASLAKNLEQVTDLSVEYLKLVTDDNIQLDAWVRKPKNFDATKKYPIVFYVYGEPWASTIEDKIESFTNYLYNGNMAADGYIQASIDVRGTPSLKGCLLYTSPSPRD